MESRTWGTAPLQEGRTTAHRIWAADFGPDYGVYYHRISTPIDTVPAAIETAANELAELAPDVHSTIGLKNESRSGSEIAEMVLGFAFASQARADEVDAMMGGEA